MENKIMCFETTTICFLTADATIHVLPVTTDEGYTTIHAKVSRTANVAGLILAYGNSPLNVLRWEWYDSPDAQIPRYVGKPGGGDKLAEIDRVSKLAGLAHLDTPLAKSKKEGDLMPKWRIKLVGQAHVYRWAVVEAPDLDSAAEKAETDFHDTPDGWTVDEIITTHPNAVHVAVNSWKRIVD